MSHTPHDEERVAHLKTNKAERVRERGRQRETESEKETGRHWETTKERKTGMQTDRQAGGQTDRQTDRQIDKETEQGRQTDRQTEKVQRCEQTGRKKIESAVLQRAVTEPRKGNELRSWRRQRKRPVDAEVHGRLAIVGELKKQGRTLSVPAGRGSSRCFFGGMKRVDGRVSNKRERERLCVGVCD